MSFAAAQEINATTETITSLLPVVAVLFPLAGSVLVLLAGLYAEKFRSALAVLTALVTFGLVLAIYPLVQHGTVIYHFADVMEYGLFFRADFLSFLFAALFAGSWLLATIYATVYMKKEASQTRFYVFLLSTLGHCLGVVLSGDLFSLFLFFELMTFSSYVLVIHRQTEQAIRAGTIMIYMGVAGGLSLLMGIFMLYWGVGTLELAPLLEEIMAAGINPLVVIPLFIVGFGIKMGMAPLHIWLPRAYEEAPSPVNAISSAAMLKAGAYGMIRILTMVFTPATPGAAVAGVEIVKYIGFAIIWVGIITMLLGATLAILQNNAKRILGCSSISQMGYILMGIGVATFLGYEKGAMGFAGSLYHIINHSVFKAALFMMVGAIYLTTLNVDITKVRGMFKKVPLVAVTFLIAYAGIGGIPGLNGYVSKTILHHAIVDAHKYGHAQSLLFAEKLFVLASAMTLVYFAKLFEGLFLGRTRPEDDEKSFKVSWVIKSLLILYSGIILAIGVFPEFVLNRLVIPAAAGFSFDPKNVAYVAHVNVWAWQDLKEPLIVFILAAVLYLILDHARAFTWKPPEWLSVEFMFYLPLTRFFFQTCCRFGASFDTAINQTYMKSGKVASAMCTYITSFDSSINDAYEKSGSVARKIVNQTERFDSSINDAYEKSGSVARNFVNQTERFDDALNDAYEKSGRTAKRLVNKTAELDGALDDAYEQSGYRSRSLWDRMRGRPSDWNIKNLNFDSLLMALMLGLFLFILIYYTKFA
ncbi:MAG: NADH dehydrogenase subunit [Clostridiales bacterium]|jgi:formate hydrogenlyase subunit 3/multisubunit Na+/H+ antiporter MnhD subunit|nr:NADH dehydrogenase subunit [Clostridiales bacterium]